MTTRSAVTAEACLKELSGCRTSTRLWYGTSSTGTRDFETRAGLRAPNCPGPSRCRSSPRRPRSLASTRAAALPARAPDAYRRRSLVLLPRRELLACLRSHLFAKPVHRDLHAITQVHLRRDLQQRAHLRVVGHAARDVLVAVAVHLFL